ncbi:hypothetical protein I5Q34_01305 [Streptomyces sp. AV19]|uniref:hypothetical protein n=1 Tax=Streptomyces sp. AV19 TaxID=2793068 RepID=UPI0018FEC2CE|nr:hypothetical protein [Streptomyces sp. AV19]MBH1932941.1 hypothetical protein [Streptomyces sp. AV19]
MSGVSRLLMMAGGGLVIAAGVVLMFFWHQRVVELTGASRLISGTGLRVAEAVVLYGGSWLCVRGWNGRRA